MRKEIKDVDSMEDFKRVYQVFSGPPYNEKYTEEELEEIFKAYKDKGYIFGAYNGEDCIGIVALEDGVQEGQPVNFESGKTMYLADIAVLDTYRKVGIGSQLMLYAVMQSKILGYQRLYMRTLEADKSMSYGIARKIGFSQIQGVYQAIERERTDGSVTSVQNIFLEIDLDNLSRDTMQKGIQAACEKKKEIER